MDNIFITQINIEKIRNLKDISIKLKENERKHLILTGKNGSGKTSVLESLSSFIANLKEIENSNKYLKMDLNNLKLAKDEKDRVEINERITSYNKNLQERKKGINLIFNHTFTNVQSNFINGDLIVAYYKADRVFSADIPKNIEKVELKKNYGINEAPRKEFVKYLLDLRATQAFSTTGNKKEKAEKIEHWFKSLEGLLKEIFGDNELELIFDEDTFQFKIKEQNKDLFDFNTLSSGYAAILDIVVDIIMRMEKKTEKNFNFDVQGIVLIDEIETHLHLELQKQILKLLTTIFPNVQFVITTHSPFILSSIENVVIYDLEKNIMVENGLANLPYEGIVEGYFNVDVLSKELKEKFEEYKKIVKKPSLSNEDFEKIGKLQMYLDEIPDYLALDLNVEYKKLKLELEARDDING